MCIVAVSLAAAVPAPAKAPISKPLNPDVEQLEGSAGAEDDLKAASSYGYGYYGGGLHSAYGGYGGYGGYGHHGYYPTYSTYSYPSYYGGHYCKYAYLIGGHFL